MRRRIVVATVVASALAGAPPLGGKEFTHLVVVGVDGSSRVLRPSPAAIADLSSSPEAARPLGGYLRLYPLDAGGHVGAPGRFYPRTDAICLSWNQAVVPRHCYRATPRLRRVLARAGALGRFRGRGPTLGLLASPGLPRPVISQLRVAVELAFDRSRLARPDPRPAACVPFTASWRTSAAARRPRRFCLAEDGVHAGGLVYPLGRSLYRLAAANRA
jgi:hypothetical protein